MKPAALLFVGLVTTAGQALATSEVTAWPTGASDPNAPEVLAFYQSQCGRYAAQNGLTDEAHAAFLSNCLSRAPEVWTVGMDEGDGGGEE